MRKEDGFSLIELLVVMALISALATISMLSFTSYRRASEWRGAARETVAILRNAQQRAVTEAQTYECRVTANMLEIYRAGTKQRDYRLPGNVEYVFSGTSHGKTHGFRDPNTSGGYISSCFLYARGSANGGLLGVRRKDNAKETDVTLESFTARVSYCTDATASCP